jgi:hypothetical protein
MKNLELKKEPVVETEMLIGKPEWVDTDSGAPI